MDLPKPFTLSEIAAVAGGAVGSGGDTKVKRVALSPLQAGEGDLALCFEPKIVARLKEVKATAVLVPEGTVCDVPHITVKRPHLALQKLLSAVQPKRFFANDGIHPTAFVDPSAKLAPDVAVGPLACIGPNTTIGARTKIGAGVMVGANVKIGEDCLLHQGALVADYVQVGNRVILQQGASLGADGFAYVTQRPSNVEVRQAGGTELSDDPNPLLKIPQIGTVVLEDDVEIGSNACIDRGTMGATTIGAGTKIDDLVMVAHNCRIGRECLIVAGTAVGGSSKLGDRVVLAGQVGITDHANIGKDAIIMAQTGVINDVPEKDVVLGSPPFPVKDFWLQIAHIKKLPTLNKEMREMRKKIAALEKALLERQLEPSKP